MPKHLWTVPSGAALPDPTGLPEGYPYALDNGDGTHPLHGLFAGSWEALGGGGGAPPPPLAPLTIPTGAALPDATGLDDGSPYILDNGDGTNTMYVVLSGAWAMVTPPPPPPP